MNTMQQEFDAVVEHLFKQGRPAREHDTYGQCRYRNPNGLKCAVGCRIPDSMYLPEMEGEGVGTLVQRNAIPEEIKAYRHMFAELQNAHDSWFPTIAGDVDTFDLGHLNRSLSKVATRFGLPFTRREV